MIFLRQNQSGQIYIFPLALLPINPIKPTLQINTNKPNPSAYKPKMSSSNNNNDAQNPIAGGAQLLTGILGNTVGGLTNTVGGVVGAAGRGLGETVNGATGGVARPVGDGLANISTGVEGGVKGVGQGVKDAGEWKKT
ncbi:hypothetical protein DL546_002906 [Coniochaeta pulveracea]|uniref:Uncharacterized protein n=1 Tax=Coniochaeta pulveracea TaxID=177199 RepID=A0A420XXY5_9PEZI|nr:hypothetical protein DL546_002906 [Coniochaeta pulveracea]